VVINIPQEEDTAIIKRKKYPVVSIKGKEITNKGDFL